MNYEKMTKEQLINHVNDVKDIFTHYCSTINGFGMSLTAADIGNNVGEVLIKNNKQYLEMLMKKEAPYNVAEAYATQDKVFGDGE